MIIEVESVGRRETTHTQIVSVDTLKAESQTPFLIGCLECSGTGWWDFAPYAVEGEECVKCKGTGRVWAS